MGPVYFPNTPTISNVFPQLNKLKHKKYFAKTSFESLLRSDSDVYRRKFHVFFLFRSFSLKLQYYFADKNRLYPSLYD